MSQCDPRATSTCTNRTYTSRYPTWYILLCSIFVNDKPIVCNTSFFFGFECTNILSCHCSIFLPILVHTSITPVVGLGFSRFFWVVEEEEEEEEDEEDEEEEEEEEEDEEEEAKKKNRNRNKNTKMDKDKE